MHLLFAFSEYGGNTHVFLIIVKNTPTTVTSYWPSKHGLRVGHLNICHLSNKITEVSNILYNDNIHFHIFGFSETLTNVNIPDHYFSQPGYTTVRRDPQKPSEAGLLMYIQNDIPFKVLDFANTNIESLWIEVRTSCKSSSSIVIGFLYRHPKCTSKWFDDFCELMDSVWLLGKEILLLGDFNIDLLNVNHSNWQNITRSYNLSQCITRPTRITHSSRTLIDHIYSSNQSSLIEICIPCIGVSDHYATCVTWSKKNFEIPRRQHTSITFRSFKRFNLTAFLSDLNLSGYLTYLLSVIPMKLFRSGSKLT